MKRALSRYYPACDDVRDAVRAHAELLSLDRQKELFEEMHSIDKDRYMSARDKLLFSIMPFAMKMTKRFIGFAVSRGIPVDDLFSEATLETVRFLEDWFDPNKGSVTTGLSFWLPNRLNEYVQARDRLIRGPNVRNKKKFSHIAKRGAKLVNETTHIGETDHPCRKEKPWLDEIERGEVRSAFRYLRTREKMIVSMRFYDGLTYKEIGHIIGVSKARVEQILKEAFETLKPKLEDCV